MKTTSWTILCVDDEPNFGDVVREALHETAYNVVSKQTPADMLAFLEEHHDEVAFILSDFRMPQMDGLQLREIVNKKWQDIPFAIISAFVDRDMALKGIDLKISAFLSKPVSSQELQKSIEKNIAGRLQDLAERAALRIGFLEEAGDILADLEPLILRLESTPADENMLSAIYRNVHTIKGASGVLERPEFTAFLHSYEDLLTKIRNHEVEAHGGVISALLAGFDKLSEALRMLNADQRCDLRSLDLSRIFVNIQRPSGAEAGSLGADREDSRTEGAAGDTSNKKEGVQVPLHLLDEFMDLSGEITVIRNMVNKLVMSLSKKIQNDDDLARLSDLLDEMHKINSEMQGQISELRKTPANHTVRRVPRLIRDLTKQLGKEVRLTVRGGDLRLDTSLAQTLSGCLTHMIRNCLDHGIETPSDRQQAGKKAVGEISIQFSETDDLIRVRLDDDGRGINPKKIAAKLVQQGLYNDSQIAAMPDTAIIQHIFASGFSTAEKVTDVSGRGVGMDMVLSSIQALGGAVSVHSQVGKGTSVIMDMPVPKSVVIISALIVEQSGERFAIPQDNLVRLLSLDSDRQQTDIRNLEGSQVLLLQDRLLPLKHLGDVLNLPKSEKKEGDPTFVVVLRKEDQQFAFIVDAINDAEDIVVKRVPHFVQCNRAYKGATFLGDGSVGLILDVEGIAERAKLLQRSSIAAAEDVSKASAGTAASYGSDLLIVGLSTPGLFAIPLSAVYRLEHLPMSQIEDAAGIKACIYRNQVMRLLDISKTLKLGELAATQNASIPVLVVNVSNRFFGLMVDRIVDLAPQSRELDVDGFASSGVAGVTIVNDQSVSILDVCGILELEGLGRWLEVVPQALPDNPRRERAAGTLDTANAVPVVLPVTETAELDHLREAKANDSETVTEEMDLSSGWGLF